MAWGLHSRLVPPTGQYLRCDVSEHIYRQADRSDRGELGDLFPCRIQAHIAGIGPDLGEQGPAVLSLELGVLVVAGLCD